MSRLQSSVRSRGMGMAEEADVIVVGGGLAGLVAATENGDAGKRVIVVDEEGEQSLGGQAFLAFDGLFPCGSPSQPPLWLRGRLHVEVSGWLGSGRAGATA